MVYVLAIYQASKPIFGLLWDAFLFCLSICVMRLKCLTTSLQPTSSIPTLTHILSERIFIMIPHKKTYVKPEFAVIYPDDPKYLEIMEKIKASENMKEQCMTDKDKK